VVGCDAQTVRRRLGLAVDFIESLHLAEIRGSDVEILDLSAEDLDSEAETPREDPLPWEKE